jgi:hypothetical protein
VEWREGENPESFLRRVTARALAGLREPWSVSGPESCPRA